MHGSGRVHTQAMRSSIVLLATLAAALSPYAAAFAPTMPASAGRAAAPGRMALRMRSDGIFSTYNKVTMMPEPAPKPDGQPRPSIPMPMVSVGEGQMDIYSRLARDRILLLGTDVNDEVANNLVAQMLFLANEDPGRDITLYINSPGGSVSAGMAIYDTMQYIPCDVATVCFGTAASMGAFLLCSGAPGKRKSLPNSRIMIHQPLGGAQGQAADIEIQAKEILFVKSLLNSYMADATGQPLDKIEEDTDRDFFMTPEEAQEYGIIDEVIQTKKSNLPKPARPMLS